MLNTFTKRLVVLLVAMMAIDETKAQLLAEFAQVPDRYTISREPSLPEVLRKLESIYKVSIAYPSDLADQKWSKEFTPNRDLTIDENLSKLLKDSGLNYRQGVGSFYVVVKDDNPPKPKEALSATVAQNDEALLEEITGVVVDEEGLPIPGASVLVKGTMVGSVTDLDGKFSIEVDSPDEAVLVVSFIGFESKEVTIGSESSLTIVMTSSTMALNEVVVTAFGLERDKKALGYAVQSVKGNELTEAQNPNVVNSLSGRVAGVQINSNSMPGSGSQVIIRGSSSVAGNNQPLVVVDGVPLDQTSSRTYGNGLSEINPDNIKEMNVLKGATAAALYGSRAANGVIMVTTKDGKGTKGIGVAINSNMTFDNPLVKPDFQNTYGGGAGYRTWYVDGRNGFDEQGIRGTAGVDESWGAPMDGRLVPLWFSAPELVPLTPQPDNWEDFWETGKTVSNNIAVSGGNDKGNFRLSVGRLDQKSIMWNNDYYRNNFKLNTGYNFTDKLNVTISAEYIKSGSDNRRYSGSSDFIWSHRHTDFTKLFNWRDYYGIQRETFRDGDDYPYANWQHEYFTNPYFLQEYYTNANEKDRMVGNIAVNYQFTDEFSLMVRTGTDFWTDTRMNVTGVERTKNFVTTKGSYTETVLRSQETNSDFIFTYDKEFSNTFSLKAQVGGINRTNYYKRNYVNVTELTIDGLYNLSNYASPVTPESTIRKQEVNSLFGSATLGFNNYLFLDVTGRNDWSSTLPVDNNSFFYPSVALSAVVTDIFNVQSNVLSFAKLRASWAQVGSDASPYMLSQVYNSEGLWAGTTPTYANASEIANVNLKPEITTGKELGLDMRFLEGRIGLDFTYYHQSTTNQILAVAISSSSGYASQVLNAGEITNKGVELMVYGTPIKSETGLTWDMSFNFSRNRNLVVELAEGLENYTLASQNSLTSEARVGQPYGTLYGRRYLRSPEGEIVYSDGLPQLEAGTFALGNIQPDWMGGFSNNFSFRNWSLGALIDIRMGGDLFDVGTGLARKTGQYAETAIGREEGVIGEGVMNVGTEETPVYVQNDVIVDAGTFWNAQNPRTYHEAGIFDGSYVKLRELTLGYSFPKNFLGNNFIQSMKLSAVGRNLAILFKNHPHMDPQVDMKGGNAQGFSYGEQPSTRSIGFNLNVTF
ncbi:SusC/RagA family TonB-linked outer membrane protein [Echinicola vietnamensis]|uniref:TonB-linked outer membrane protein, SusC/RagA family n=1 Tax=Echinicola vietnamensis (strain DSM 17526 / LMG 23754 / KMM 6221) TaxID=926556 RepID=L0G1C3_ECHVK|nr:SusC/RagA family TonB-linked outer membrane protein [Echinicola vietnamensis]AGA79093.1 TonB-linked outer membrane protein, SusC/RagA family [Echinicola vietnamensis DSM 17526]